MEVKKKGLTVRGIVLVLALLLFGVGCSKALDSDVVAVVGELEVLRRDIRVPAAFAKQSEPELSDEQAIERVIVSAMDQAIMYAEARSQGLQASVEEAQAYRDSMREECYGPQGQECRDFIDQLGIPEDEYWSDAVAGYRRGLSVAKLMQAVFAENDLSDATNEELVAFKVKYVDTLRGRASILWKDSELERIYHQAQRQRK